LRPRNSRRSEVQAVCRPPRSANAMRDPYPTFQGLRASSAPVSGSTAVTIDGHAFLLKEMLNNVLDNALRYTQGGGQVTVRVVPDTSSVMLSVEDTGLGIPEAERERVFERFYRVLHTGTDGCGLGLAIVREIAQSHGAQIRLDSGRNGVGTAVQITFPRSAV